MKKIVFIIVALFIAIVTMAYLYFSGLSSEHKNSQHSLYAAAANSSLIFSFENEESIVDILKSQELLKEVIGVEKAQQLEAISDLMLKVPGLQKFFDKQSVYIALFPSQNKSIDFLYSTQINADFTIEQLMQTLKIGEVKLKQRAGFFDIAINDSTECYVGIKENLLLLSSDSALVKNTLSAPRQSSSKFADFIQANSRVAKNSLGEVYINFETLPNLLKSALPGKLEGELAPLKDQKTFAALVYNFSKEKLLLTGTTVPQTTDNYYSIFAHEPPQKISITNILPDNTASYTAYAVSSHVSFRKLLKKWFKEKGLEDKAEKAIADINTNYRIDLETLLPTYFKDQFITFQLNTSENLGALSLVNGDKMDQLLLELSNNYTEEIKQLKINGLLYYFFGDAFRNFQKPYYTIVDNYMIFANRPEPLQDFLLKYRANKLLITDNNYSNSMEQLSGSANIHFYIDLPNSERLAQRNIFSPSFRHLYKEDGLKSYASVSYQLSSENNKFLTSLLLVKKQPKVSLDSLTISK
jgi:hypothetical protein